MTIEQKIGQLFILGFKGDRIDNNHPIAQDIRQRNLGGVILFDRLLARQQPENNIINASQVKSLTTSLQDYSTSPLLIAVDQEGGLVKRFKAQAGFPETASAQTLGKTDDPTLTRIHASCTAAILASVGVNFNLAPVTDLNTFPENPVIGALQRSFSDSSDAVIRHAAMWIGAHTELNILSCLKHFPGHGSSRADSHLGFTDISSSWQQEELVPFAKLIEMQMADAIMLGHLFHKNLDPEYPTSLSIPVVSQLLRKQLGYNGLIVTDDIQMRAITDQYGLEEAACLALAAGVDMIIVGNNLDYQPEILQKLTRAVLRAIADKKLSVLQIESAWKRVQQVKRKLKEQ